MSVSRDLEQLLAQAQTISRLRKELVTTREQLDEARENIRQLREMVVPATYVEFRGLTLTHGERILLNTLFLANGAAVSRERIRAVLDTALNNDDPGASISTFVCHLRAKLAAVDPPIRITTLYRFGHRLEPEYHARLAARRISPLEK